MRIIFLNRASTETRMRLVVLVLYFSRDCKAGCSYFHGALSCLHSPILRSDTSTIVITAGETVRAVCFGVCRHLRVSLMFALLCVLQFFFCFSFAHNAFSAPLWKAMDAYQVVCLHYALRSFALSSFFSSPPFFLFRFFGSVTFSIASSENVSASFFFGGPITHQPDCVCWVQTVT